MGLSRRRFIPILGTLAAGAWARAAAAASPPTQGAHAGAATPEQIWAELMEGNGRFVAGKLRPRNLAQLRSEIAKGQQPKVIVLGCSDSRVDPTTLFDQAPGDLFVVRTAGNVAGPVDLGSMEYAAEHLHSSVLLVLGHRKCGAVAAALSGEKMPSPNLEAIVAKIAPAVEKVRGRAEGDQLLQLAIDANVEQSAKDVLASSPILAKAVEAGKLTVKKAVYKLASGKVVRL
jgi:carbonic anhydrase